MKSVLISFALLWPTALFAFDEPTRFKPDALKWVAEMEYITSSANFDPSGGSFTDLPNGGEYQLIDFNFGAHWGLSSNWEALGNLGLGWAQSSDGISERSNSQLHDLQAGGRYRHRWKNFLIYPEALLTIPIAEIEANQDAVMTNEGVMEVLTGAWAKTPLFGLTHYLYLGYNYRDEGRAGLLTWKLASHYARKSFLLGLELKGIEPVTDDKDRANPNARQSLNNRVAGGSLSFYSVNPQYLRLGLVGGYRLSPKTKIQASLHQDINGANVALSQSAFLRLSWLMPMAESASNSEFKRSINPNQRSLKQKRRHNEFQIEAEEYDESLFLPDPDDEISPAQDLDEE